MRNIFNVFKQLVIGTGLNNLTRLSSFTSENPSLSEMTVHLTDVVTATFYDKRIVYVSE